MSLSVYTKVLLLVQFFRSHLNSAADVLIDVFIAAIVVGPVDLVRGQASCNQTTLFSDIR